MESVPPLDDSDESIALRVQNNNNEVFGLLMQRYQAKLTRYGRRFLARSEHIEDIVQDVFIKAYQNIQSFDTNRRFSPWIYRIAHNAFVNALREKHRDPLVFIDMDTFIAHPSYDTDPALEEERAEMQVLIDKGITSLSPQYREVIVLYYIENISYQEIADIIHVPLGTVGVRLMRAREALKKYVTKP